MPSAHASTGAFLVLLAVTAGAASSGHAGQALIPSPYPTAVPGGQPLDPLPTPTHGPQRLKDDPYPQILGENAQGNPPISERHRQQRLVPSIYQRKYRVDRR